ncbi:Flavohemoprotein B5+B5R [Giardia lamblia P15]|uniref:Flavohemoprotein B5+B5R n=1 Tax=Giardia intestinalis (strain P15) TaxID=658858 RepID=E1F8V6_GIAIA|nr:Flavohemoprotein B5+B5R [Giardia lamblia P15]
MKGGNIAQRRDAMMRAYILSKVRQRTDAEINNTFYTPEEIASHASMDDAWMSYRGKVYDITHYIRYHPGGLQCMQEYMGKDMTHAADSVHKWVNVATMLRPLAIGTLKTSTDNSNTFSCLPAITEVAEEENSKDTF